MKRGIFIMVLNAIFTIAVISLSWYGAEILLYGYSQPSVVKAFAVLYMTLSSLAHQTRRGVVIYGTKEAFLPPLHANANVHMTTPDKRAENSAVVGWVIEIKI